MDDWGGHWAMMALMMALMSLFWIALIAGLVLLIAWVIQKGGRRSIAEGPSVEEDPLTILKRRYARGEISREEYERMRQELS